MNEKTTSQVLVIGLGGCGGQIVNSIQESEADHITCLHLDWNSQIFGDFFSGYMHQVGKRILDGVQSFRSELLDALSPEELRQYIAHYQWRQAHEVFPEKPRSMYQSKAYFLLRTNQFIYDAKLVLAEHGEIKSDGSEVIDHEE